MTKQGGRANRPDRSAAAEALAVAALAFIAGEPERLGRFLAMSGIGPDSIRAAAREVGGQFLEAGQPAQAWSYFRMIDDPKPVQEALEKLQPGEDDDIQPIIQLAFYEGLAPRKGFDLLLGRYGTCSAVTTMSSAELPFGDDVRQYCIKALVRRLYADLRANLANAVAAAIV